MKPMSILASSILPNLAAPMRLSAILGVYEVATSTKDIDSALDELLAAGLVSLDEDGAGVPCYYRRDLAAEKAIAAKWDMKRRMAERARSTSIAAAEQAFAAAMDAADAERDAASPMAALKAVAA